MDKHQENCSKCGERQLSLSPECPVCGTHIGFPNVRAANAPDEIDALKARFDTAQDEAASNGLSTEFKNLISAVDEHSNVTVALPVEIAMYLVTSITNQYVGYEIRI